MQLLKLYQVHEDSVIFKIGQHPKDGEPIKIVKHEN